jgi:GYF domain 2
MQKEWYLLIQGKKEGPYHLIDLQRDKRITPDTLVWKMGFHNWIAIRYVPELESLFKDEKPPNDSEDSPEIDQDEQKTSSGLQEVTMALRYDPPQFYFWLLVAAILICYVFYLLNSKA